MLVRIAWCFALPFLVCPAFPAGGAPGGEALKLSDAEKKLLELTNAERAAHKSPELKPSPLLFRIARAHTDNMAKQGKAGHVLDGKDQFQRLKAGGYRYSTAGENVANGEGIELADVIKGWMESKGHRANLLNPRFTEVGLAIARDEKGVIYLTQLFAAPKSADGDAPNAQEQLVFEAMNAARTEAKVPALKPSKKLNDLARAHSENMARQRMLAHTLDKKGPGDRLKEAGYAFFTYAENVYGHFGTPEKVAPTAVPAWLSSEGHKKNLLNPQLTEVGVGMATDDRGYTYFTTLFAAPRK